MKLITLDGAKIKSIDALHDFFSEALSFPDHYGRNLDALYDCLWEVPEPLCIFVIHVPELLAALGKRGPALLALLRQVSEESDRVLVSIEGEEE